jgi:hypothetical protein
MKTITILFVCLGWSICSYAQVDLSRDPSKPATAKPKSNAELLKEATPAPPAPNPDLQEQLKSDAATSGTTTGRSYIQTGSTPNMAPGQSQMMNSTSTQQQLGNGLKTNSAVYYDETGKVKSSGTTIQFGGKKK